MAEYLRVLVSAQHFSHVLREEQHTVELVDISVLAGDVLLYNLAVVDESIVLVACASCQDGEVFVCYLGCRHLCGEEVGHHRCCGVGGQIDALLVIAEASPIVLVVSVVAVGNVFGEKVGDGVSDVRCCLASESLASLWDVVVAATCW